MAGTTQTDYPVSSGDPRARRLLLLAGDQRWGEDWLMGRLGSDDLADTLWVANTAPPAVSATPAGKVTAVLGGECRCLVFNAHQGLHPDVFAAAVGTLRGGGDCVVLAPSLGDWPAFADPDKARFAAYPHSPGDMRGLFVERLVRLWNGHPASHVVTPGSQLHLRMAAPAVAGFRLTEAQEAAVEAVRRVAHGHARRPLVISADRGRGKSTVLGVAAARLLLEGCSRVTVVAPQRTAVSTLFRHALATVGRPGREVADTHIGEGSLRFRLPAECMALAEEEPGLIMVDEAAAIPVAVLGSLLERSNRLVFASTAHGYEGSGRGFDLRFRSLLQSHMPQWRALHLSEPVRWSIDDPLETLVNDCFLLDAELAGAEDADAYSIERVDPRLLVHDEALLRSTFGLLINAHYQTRPSDLRQLLDNPDVQLWLARAGGSVAGVLLATVEGGFDEAMAGLVLSGARRPRGHLLPQSLAVHAGLDQALILRLLRIQRIAVHPGLQRSGLGRSLIETAADWASGQGFDALGCAYGVDPALLAFWQALGFRVARAGVRVDPASAAHSLFMLRGLGPAGSELAAEACRRFQAQLPWSLAASLRDLDSRIAVQLLRGRACSDLVLSVIDRRDLERIATGSRQAATAEALVWRALVVIASRGRFAVDELAPLIAWRLQYRAVEPLCRAFSIPGRRALDGRLRALLGDPEMPGSSTG